MHPAPLLVLWCYNAIPYEVATWHYYNSHVPLYWAHQRILSNKYPIASRLSHKTRHNALIGTVQYSGTCTSCTVRTTHSVLLHLTRTHRNTDSNEHIVHYSISCEVTEASRRVNRRSKDCHSRAWSEICYYMYSMWYGAVL